MPDVQNGGKESAEAARLRGFHGERGAWAAEVDGSKEGKTAAGAEGETAAGVGEGEVATEVVVGRQTKDEDAAKGEGRHGGVRGDDAHGDGDVHAGASACETCRCQMSPPSGYLRHPEGCLESRWVFPRHIP